MNQKQLIISLLFPLLSLSGCSGTDSNNIDQSNDANSKKWSTHYLNRVGYITTKTNSPNNLIMKTIDSSSAKFNYRLDGSSDLAFKMKDNTTRIYKADKEDRIIDSLKILEQNRVGLVFVEGSEKFNKTKIYDAIKIDKVYTGRLIIVGENIKSPKNNAGETISSKKWIDKRIGVFEYSKIISAYMTGYLTQTNFGLTKDGTKKSVGYILGVAYEAGKSTKRKEDIKKAVAFRQGIIDAAKEQKTGEVYFVPKSQATFVNKSLIFDSSSVPSKIEELAKDKKYINSDHSFTYISGASREINYDIASRLTLRAAKNALGHKVIVDSGATDEGYAFEYSSDVNVIEGEEGENPKKNATARVSLAFNNQLEFAETFDYARSYATKAVIENVLKMIFINDKIDNYFNKNNRFGTFGIVMKSGRNTISPSMQEAQLDLRDTLSDTIEAKKLDESKFDDDSFFGKA